MHSFWLAAMVPGLAILVSFFPRFRRVEVWALLFWILAVCTLAFYGLDLGLFLKAGNGFEQILPRILWRFLISNSIPLVQGTIAAGVAWVLTARWSQAQFSESNNPESPDAETV